MPPEQPPSAPRTEAGRHFLDVVLPRYGGLRQSAGKWTRSEFTDAILAIEAEAAAIERREGGTLEP